MAPTGCGDDRPVYTPYNKLSINAVRRRFAVYVFSESLYRAYTRIVAATGRSDRQGDRRGDDRPVHTLQATDRRSDRSPVVYTRGDCRVDRRGDRRRDDRRDSRPAYTLRNLHV